MEGTMSKELDELDDDFDFFSFFDIDSNEERLAQKKVEYLLKEKRFKVQIAEFEALANASGSSEDQYRVAVCYAHGPDIRNSTRRNNEEKTFVWAKLAADQGHGRAQALLAHCYVTGNGVEKDDEKAIDYYQRSAQQGYVVAETALGVYYLIGDHVQQNTPLALHWLGRAARHGSTEAMIKLAELNSAKTRWGGRPDRAFKWLLRAARLGSPKAKEAVAYAYFYGIGTDRNYNHFLYWVQSAAADENHEAEKMLEYANEYIYPEKRDLHHCGLPSDFCRLKLRRRTVIKMMEDPLPPIKDMIADTEALGFDVATFAYDIAQTKIDRLKSIYEQEIYLSATTRH